jgi:signal transduction histidine kinase
MRPLSLVWRIRLVSLFAAMLVVAPLAAIAYQRFRSAHIGQLDRILEAMAHGIAAVVAAEPRAEGLEGEIAAIAVGPWRGPRNEFRVWLDGAAADIASSTADRESEWSLAGQSAPPLGEPRFFDLAHKQKRMRAAWLRRESAGGIVNVLVLHPANWEQRRLDELLAVLLGTGATATLLAGLAAGPLSRLTLGPLRLLGDRISAFRPDARESPPPPPLPAELLPLARRIEELAGRFTAALDRQRSIVSDASHQLRTPLALARSTLELALARPSPCACREPVQEALADLGRMQRLVEQLVLLGRVQSGAETGPAVELRLDSTLEELVASLEPRAHERGIRLVSETPVAAVVAGDETLLRFLFAGLLENALQYGPARGTVHVRLEHGPAGHCTVTVQDDGGRIPPPALDRLFERFYRAEGSDALHPTGAGLGLTIAREIARRHGGDVWATSSPGTRTTFHVKLPVADRG